MTFQSGIPDIRPLIRVKFLLISANIEVLIYVWDVKIESSFGIFLIELSNRSYILEKYQINLRKLCL